MWQRNRDAVLRRGVEFGGVLWSPLSCFSDGLWPRAVHRQHGRLTYAQFIAPRAGDLCMFHARSMHLGAYSVWRVTTYTSMLFTPMEPRDIVLAR